MPYDNNTPRYNNQRPGGYTPKYPGGGYNAKPKSSSKKDDASTDGVLMYNEHLGKFLRSRFWNRCMSLEIGNVTPNMPLSGEMMRNAQVFGHTFSFTTMFELDEICQEVLESIKTTGKFESTATESGQKHDAIVEISNGANIGQPEGIYLTIYKNVDTGKRTNSFENFRFGNTQFMKNYDHASGNFAAKAKNLSEFKKFAMMMHEAAKAFTMAQAHAVKDSKKQDLLSIMTTLTAMSSALGVDVSAAVSSATSGSTRQNGQSSYQRGGNRYGSQSPSQYQRTSQPGQWQTQKATPGQWQTGHALPAGGNPNGTPMTPYQNQQAVLSSVTDEPVDINLDAATLRNTTLDDFA